MITRLFDPTSKFPTFGNDTKRINLWMFGLTFTLACIIPILYVTSEHIFYWWDYAGYQDLTNVTADNFLIDPLVTLKDIYSSTQYDYNIWFTIPLIPFVVVGGFSRRSYVLGVTVVYFYPFALIVGSIAARLIPTSKQNAFWLAVTFTLCMPPAWVATFRGYPDIGGALFLAAALLFYLGDSDLESKKSILLIGFLLAIAILFRRHFAFGAVGFLVSVFIYSNTRVITLSNIQGRDKFGKILFHNLHLALIPIMLLATLFLLARPLLHNLLSRNYTSLYSSYAISPQGIAYYLLSQYGVVIWAVATMAVLWVSIRQGRGNPFTFIGLLAFILFTQWVFFVRQWGYHYTLQFLFFLVIGLCLFGRMLADIRRGVLASYFLTGGLALNLIFGLTTLNPLINTTAASLLAANQPPLQHPDYAEIQNMLHYLYQNAEQGEPILVAASSDLLNYDILRHAENVDDAPEKVHLNFLRSPDADSRDDYPLEQLIDAQYVIVASPFQYHLAPEEQDVVHVVVDAFLNDWPIAQDFDQLDASFQLSNNTDVKIFHRIRPTSISTAVQTLRGIQDYLSPEIPGKQPDWIALDGRPATITYKTATNATYAFIEISSSGDVSTLLFSRELPEQASVNGILSPQTSCSEVSATVRLLDEQANIVFEKQVDLKENQFHQQIDKGRAAHAILEISGQTPVTKQSCTVVIETLVVTVP